MQPNKFVPVDPSQRTGGYAHPSPCQLVHKRHALRKHWACLLAAPLATLVGCGTLGGLPGGGFMGQPTAAALSAPLPEFPTAQAPVSNRPEGQQPTHGQAAPTPLASHEVDRNTAATQAAATRAAVTQAAATQAAATQAAATQAVGDAAENLAPVVPAAFRTPISPATADGHLGVFDAACPPADAGAECSVCAPAAAGADAAGRYRNAQEYIFDGGDQQPTVIIKQDWTAAGVDPTDTVIYYETLAGSVCVQPSNRVPIYAPRFGAVRQVSGLQLATRAMGTERILAPVSVERFDENNLAGTVVQPVAPQGEQQVGLIDAFQENYVAPPLEQVLPLYRMSAARVPFELIDPTRTGLITIQELVDVQEFIQNAQTWVNPESLEVEISNQTAILLKDTMAAQEVFVYELPDGCAMRIFKAASHTIANSGDIVSFTIRFDNSGVKPLGNAVIIDNLSPRLAYIQGSQQCSVGVRFSAEPNEVGSMVLRWEIEDAIEPTQGGVISFDCRVR